MATINGRDTCGDKSFIQVTKEDSKIHIYSPEDASAVVLNAKQTKELIKALQDALKE